MKNSKKYLIAVFLLISTASCATRQPVQVVTEYAHIPATFQTIPEIPPIPQSDTITVAEGVNLANRLRISNCILRSRYKELLRYATQGNIILDQPSNLECPNDIN